MTDERALALLLTAVIAAALLAWWWWVHRGTNRVAVQPASTSVSWEHMLEEADAEQLRYMRRGGEL